MSHMMNATALLAKLRALVVTTPLYQSTTTRFRFDEFHHQRFQAGTLASVLPVPDDAHLPPAASIAPQPTINNH